MTVFAPAATAASISAPAPARLVSADAILEATNPSGLPFWSKAVESETVCVVSSLPPLARSASRTLRIVVALAARAARAVGARDSTPAEIWARSGTAVTTPVPLTVTVSMPSGASTAAAPSGRSTPASATAVE